MPDKNEEKQLQSDHRRAELGTGAHPRPSDMHSVIEELSLAMRQLQQVPTRQHETVR